ncbi:MAG TPA: hypothetical protein PLX60_05185 [Chitinophagales bacterium]|jgi:hypothetical protein|nr:hypothetical protein [Chitinophagales bacterium]HPH88395.1 hypothetical protein [Chitinophagales bacterium]
MTTRILTVLFLLFISISSCKEEEPVSETYVEYTYSNVEVGTLFYYLYNLKFHNTPDSVFAINKPIITDYKVSVGSNGTFKGYLERNGTELLYRGKLTLNTYYSPDLNDSIYVKEISMNADISGFSVDNNNGVNNRLSVDNNLYFLMKVMYKETLLSYVINMNTISWDDDFIINENKFSIGGLSYSKMNIELDNNRHFDVHTYQNQFIIDMNNF